MEALIETSVLLEAGNIRCGAPTLSRLAQRAPATHQTNSDSWQVAGETKESSLGTSIYRLKKHVALFTPVFLQNMDRHSFKFLSLWIGYLDRVPGHLLSHDFPDPPKPRTALVFFDVLVFGYICVCFAIPETKGLTLEEVNELYRSGIPPWRSVGWRLSEKHYNHSA
ncbi:hypothetical protein DFH29DRAFT_430719 [Suillus ampliporus]|nr:hypothetical protein DFH29DRAFT_430719 [Suillus ampliporus]